MVANLFKEVEEFHEAQSKLFDEEKRDIEQLGGRRLQSVQNNMLLDSGHAAYQLSQSQKWSDFTVPDPIQLITLSDGLCLLTSHDSENACQLINIDP